VRETNRERERERGADLIKKANKLGEGTYGQRV
jgi:hypothetical protein